MARAAWTGSMSASTSTARKNNWRRSMALKRGGASHGFCADGSEGAGVGLPSCQSANKTAFSTGMAALPALGRVLGVALQSERQSILDDPLDGFALLQFQGFGQRGRADEVELPGLVGAFDELDFGEVAHRSTITLAI